MFANNWPFAQQLHHCSIRIDNEIEQLNTAKCAQYYLILVYSKPKHGIDPNHAISFVIWPCTAISRILKNEKIINVPFLVLIVDKLLAFTNAMSYL